MKKIVLDILKAVYDYGGISFLSAVILWLALWLFYRRQNVGRLLLLTYIFLVLNLTLFDRVYFEDPFTHLTTGFALINENGGINYEGVENLVMLLPLIPLVGLSGLFGNVKVYIALIICFGFSVLIEVMQGICHLGAVQISDVVFNTLGGMAGWLIYELCYVIYHRYKD